MEIFNLKDKLEYLDEVVRLEYEEWAEQPDVDRLERMNLKKNKICKMFEHPSFCKLILVDDCTLIGFISIFPNDCEEEKELTPWYATMYVKKDYRHHGYSRILNDAILKEAKNRGFQNIYLKTNLQNYYERFGAIMIKKLKTGEFLYQFDLSSLSGE